MTVAIVAIEASAEVVVASEVVVAVAVEVAVASAADVDAVDSAAEAVSKNLQQLKAPWPASQEIKSSSK
jgi:hypothetical protein